MVLETLKGHAGAPDGARPRRGRRGAPPHAGAALHRPGGVRALGEPAGAQRLSKPTSSRTCRTCCTRPGAGACGCGRITLRAGRVYRPSPQMELFPEDGHANGMPLQMTIDRFRRAYGPSAVMRGYALGQTA